MGNVVIVTGMSGVKPKRVLEKFNVFLGKQGKQPISVVDLEKLLVEEAISDPVCKASPDFMKSLEAQEPIITVTSLPYPMLNRLWGQAVEKAEGMIEEEKNKDRNVALVLHAVYFNAKSTEFVPIVDVEKLRTLNAKYVVHLVDDIYDVYAWLRCEGGIYDEYTYPGGEFKQVKKSIQYLVSTLVWRKAEAGASAHLAALLGNVPVLTLATKHRCGLLQKIFDGSISRVYLSHPISEARRLRSEGNTEPFDDWSNRVSSLADHLSQELAVWEPTTIDEWIIPSINIEVPVDVLGEQVGDRKKHGIISDNNSKRIELYLPRLLERWPFGRVEEVLWSKPEEPLEEPLDPAGFFTDAEIKVIQGAKTCKDIEEGLRKKKSLELCCISGELEHLVALIGEQINSRDRTLIRQCPTLVIYRPLFNGNSAGGVLNELRAHRSFTELKHYMVGPKVFVLEDSDDEKLLWRNTVVKLICGPAQTKLWFSYICELNGQPISNERAIQIGDFVTKYELTATKIVEKMDKARKELNFRWGKEPGLLNGLGKGRAWRAFCKQRTTELETAFTQQIEYQRVLAEYDDSMVYRSKDIDVTSFAKKVVDILKDK